MPLMTTSTRFIVLLASTAICLLSLFPPRVSTTIPQTEVSRGFLLRGISHGEMRSCEQHVVDGVPRQMTSVSNVPCRIDGTRLAAEILAVLSAAAVLVSGLTLRPATPSTPTHD